MKRKSVSSEDSVKRAKIDEPKKEKEKEKDKEEEEEKDKEKDKDGDKPKSKEEILKEKGFDDAALKAMKQAEEIEKKITAIDDQAAEEYRKLNVTYHAKRRPLYEQRQLILGKMGKLWSICAKKHFTDKIDRAILEHLTDVDHTYHEDAKGHKLILTFSPNKFFSNKQLTKDYREIPKRSDDKDKDKDKDKDGKEAKNNNAADDDDDDLPHWMVTTSRIHWTDTTVAESEDSQIALWFTARTNENEDDPASASASASAKAKQDKTSKSKDSDSYEQSEPDDLLGGVFQEIWKDPLGFLESDDFGDADGDDDADGEGDKDGEDGAEGEDGGEEAAAAEGEKDDA